MIACFPKIYQDELAYSIFARYYLKSGFTTLRDVMEELYVNKWYRVDVEFINKLLPEAKKILTQNMTLQEFIEKHTMFPYYGRFIDCTRRKKALDSLVNGDGNYRNLLPIQNRKNEQLRYLRYCPKCVFEDRIKYGETYWHRIHQLKGVEICNIHRCYLVNTQIAINVKETCGLKSAEQEIVNLETIYCNNKRKIEFTNYVVGVFESDINYKETNGIGRFLINKLGKKYISKNGIVNRVSLLYDDYQLFFNDLNEIMTLTQMKKIFNGYRWNCFEVCQIAFFENISISELVNYKSDIEEKKMNDIYRHLAVQYDLSFSIVKTIGNEVLKKYYTRSRVQNKSGPQKYNWNMLDEQLLPKVKKIIKETYYNTNIRPIKINANFIIKTLNLTSKSIDNLPKCKIEIDKYSEQQEHYWAREVVWAVKKIVDEGTPLSWRRIRDLTNMRKENFIECLGNISGMVDEELEKQICELI